MLINHVEDMAQWPVYLTIGNSSHKTGRETKTDNTKPNTATVLAYFLACKIGLRHIFFCLVFDPFGYPGFIKDPSTSCMLVSQSIIIIIKAGNSPS